MSDYKPRCGSTEKHDWHHMMDQHFKPYYCSGVCDCGSTHIDIPRGIHSPGEHK